MSITEKIKSFADLAPNWDRDGGRTISADVIRSSLEFLAGEGVPEPTFVIPTGSGGVQLEWNFYDVDVGPSVEIEIEFTPDSSPIVVVETDHSSSVHNLRRATAILVRLVKVLDIETGALLIQHRPFQAIEQSQLDELKRGRDS